MGYLNLAPKGKKTCRARWWSSRNRKQNPPFNAVDSQKQKQTAGNKLPQPDHYIWKNWKRGLMGPAIEKFDRVDKIGIIKAHIGPHPIQLIER
jgi:hypothetical protein